ncbi:MAG: FAD-binding oxidoreductase [Candidatus Helarchaeota archaeon]
MLSIDVIKELENIVGAPFVSTAPEDLYIYSRDMTESEPGNPDAIVMPSSVEEVQKIMQLANELKIPVVPYVSGANIGGLTIATKGGIILDLKRMKKVVKFDPENKYIVVEPGFTFGHMKKFLSDKDFIYSYAFSPPYTSVVANALLQGLTEYSLKYGCMANWITGLEIVLPTGEIVQIGSHIISDKMWGKNPLPDMVGLITGWQGTTGVVTKMGLKLLPKPPIKKLYGAVWNSIESAEEGLKFFTDSGIVLGEFSFSWECILMLSGAKYPLRKIREDEPKMLSGFILHAENKKHLKIQEEILREKLHELNEKYKRKIDNQMLPVEIAVTKKIQKMLDLPSALPPFMEFRTGIDGKKGTGMSWLGTYCPRSNWTKSYNKGYEIMKKHGFTPLIFVKVMDNGRYHVVRFLVPFNKNVEGEPEKVRNMLEELLEMTLDNEAIPYKMPSWAASKVIERADPEWVKTMKKIKKCIDPNGIMNPGRWQL